MSSVTFHKFRTLGGASHKIGTSSPSLFICSTEVVVVQRHLFTYHLHHRITGSFPLWPGVAVPRVVRERGERERLYCHVPLASARVFFAYSVPARRARSVALLRSTLCSVLDRLKAALSGVSPPISVTTITPGRDHSLLHIYIHVFSVVGDTLEQPNGLPGFLPRHLAS